MDKVDCVTVVSSLNTCFALSFQVAVIEYTIPAFGIFEVTLTIKGRVSATLYEPVSRLVENLIDSSATGFVEGGVVPESVLVHDNANKKPKAKINLFILVILIYPLGVVRI